MSVTGMKVVFFCTAMPFYERIFNNFKDDWKFERVFCNLGDGF